MKINGKVYNTPNVEYIVIPRPDGDIIFQAQAILDMDEFDKLCPRPVAPMGMVPGGKPQPDTSDQSYKLSVADYGERRFNFIIVYSLRATEGLEWDSVSLIDPSSWGNFKKDLKAACFVDREIQMVIEGCLAANSLSETRVEEARSRFLALQEVLRSASSSQTAGRQNT
jgi:hypothetical protein